MNYRKQFVNRFFVLLVLGTMLLISAGCTSMPVKKELSLFNTIYSKGQYIEAANFELKEAGGEKTGPSKLLQKLQAATALRYAKQYSDSTKLFDECEDAFKHYNEKNRVASSVVSVLVNDTVLGYRGEEYDGIMVNTYKALNFWKLGEKDLARTEFNRALDRQRRAKERFAKEISKMKEDIAKKQAKQDAKAKKDKKPTININEAVNNPEIGKILGEKYSNLHAFEAYPDFINPFTTYMAGLFFMSVEDYSKASTLLKEAYGMIGENQFVTDDFAKLENALDGKTTQDKYVWIIFENGLGPVKEELSINLPIVYNKEAVFTGIALPKLNLRKQAYCYLTVSDQNSDKGEIKTEPLASMERVIQTEFEKDYTIILTKAIISAAIKTYAQYAAGEQYGAVGKLAGIFYQAATTSADIRIWSALPNNFQVAKVKCPENGSVTITTPDDNKIEVEVPADECSLIYIKIPKAGANISYDILKL